MHDSVEDCDLSFDVIVDKYGEDVANGVKLMTKPDGDYIENQAFIENTLFKQNYVDYLVRLYQQYLSGQTAPLKAMIVKLSDLKSNLNYQRLGVKSIDELNQKQLNNLLKYHTAYRLLESIVFDKKNLTIDEVKAYLYFAQYSDEYDKQAIEHSIHQIINWGN